MLKAKVRQKNGVHDANGGEKTVLIKDGGYSIGFGLSDFLILDLCIYRG